MSKPDSTQNALSSLNSERLFAACIHEAEQLGGDERTADYFFRRAQAAHLALTEQGNVTVTGMDIAAWCAAIAWSAPGIRRKQPRSGARART